MSEDVLKKSNSKICYSSSYGIILPWEFFIFYQNKMIKEKFMKYFDYKNVDTFREYLENEEKAFATIQKYLHDISEFKMWLGDRELTKALVLSYKAHIAKKYAIASVNSVISSLNSFFSFMGWNELKVKTVKVQKCIFSSEEKALTKEEYTRLLCAAEEHNDKRLYLLMQCICSTGIRVSELKYITVESLFCGRAEINNKGKIRVILLPSKLCKALSLYARKQKIKSGAIFVSKNGRPLDRSNIWLSMKKLCKAAGVAASKVFPHNLRHLFARTYYSVQKDIVRLSDILGHSNINTTRIYTQENGDIHRQQIQRLGLLRC